MRPTRIVLGPAVTPDKYERVLMTAVRYMRARGGDVDCAEILLTKPQFEHMWMRGPNNTNLYPLVPTNPSSNPVRGIIFGVNVVVK